MRRLTANSLYCENRRSINANNGIEHRCLNAPIKSGPGNPREVMLKMAKVFMKTMNKVMGKNRRGGTSTKKTQGKQASSNNTTSSAAVEEDIAEDLWEEEEDFLIPNSRL